MANLDRLEQLSRLRASGDLSEEEYQREKSKALTPSRKPMIFAAAAIAIAAVGGIAYTLEAIPLTSTLSEPQRRTSAPEQSSVISPASMADPNSNTSEQVARRSHAWAASSDLVGKNPEYIRAQLGPPETRDGAFWSYTIEGCSVTYTMKNARVEVVSAEVNSKCRPFLFGKAVKGGDTFGKYAGGNGFLAADCVSSCGNAYDPPAYLVMPGFRANGFIDVVYSSVDYDALKWADDIRRRAGLSEDAIDDGGIFQCAVNPSASVARMLRDTKIDHVQVGYNLIEKSAWCGRA